NLRQSIRPPPSIFLCYQKTHATLLHQQRNFSKLAWEDKQCVFLKTVTMQRLLTETFTKIEDLCGGWFLHKAA
ncbi:Uncharacterized protein DAT39_013896, partial [Clarias magur]